MHETDRIREGSEGERRSSRIDETVVFRNETNSSANLFDFLMGKKIPNLYAENVYDYFCYLLNQIIDKANENKN